MKPGALHAGHIRNRLTRAPMPQDAFAGNIPRIGAAPIVRRRTSTFPSRVAGYFDFTQWGGGFSRVANQGPGAVCINHAEGIMADIQTGRVYRDSRFIKGQE